MDYSPPPSRDCIALVIYSEARGELLLGQILAAKTLINRAVKNQNGLCEEATRSRQFHGVEKYMWPNKFSPDPQEWAWARKVADFTVEHLWNVHSYCGQPLYFNAGQILKQYKHLCTVGKHHFYE